MASAAHGMALVYVYYVYYVYYPFALATPMRTQPVRAREIAAPSTAKLRLPVISLKTKTPHSAETTPGPEVMSGKATATESEALATNHAVWAAAHMRPERKPGKMTRG